ncbi:MAG: aldo/keto reductase [Pseudomonadota bacterium]
MDYRPLGRSDLKVSALCLGSMFWGSRNTEAEGRAQIDRSLAAGINFIDTAELYPTAPVIGEKCGETERVIGTWFARTGRRDEVILATKISGEGAPGARGGEPVTAAAMHRAVDASLKRLQTDVIDLYQLHWPNRGSYHFRKYWAYDPATQSGVTSRDETRDHIAEVLEAADALIKAGKIRHLGLSNESAWGTQQFLEIAEANGLPRVVGVQNEYSLLCRIFDTDFAELCHQEDVGLLAYSPLAAGLLSGKYRDGEVPDCSRGAINKGLGGRMTPRAHEAVAAYLEIADGAGLDPNVMALAWCLTRPFMASVIFGASTMDQLENLLEASEVTLSEDVMAAIGAAHKAHPMPF